MNRSLPNDSRSEFSAGTDRITPGINKQDVVKLLNAGTKRIWRRITPKIAQLDKRSKERNLQGGSNILFRKLYFRSKKVKK